MAIFNSRIRIIGGREQQRDRKATDVHISLGPINQTSTARQSPQTTVPADAVHVHEEVWVHTDSIEIADMVRVSLVCI